MHSKLLLLLGLICSTAYAEYQPQFDSSGAPDAKFKQQIDSRGGPALISGANLVGAKKDSNGEWQALDEDACITIRFHVNEKGMMDRYVVLYSEPEGLIEKAILASLSRWRFAQSSEGFWFVLPFSWSVKDAINRFGSDTRLAKAHASSKFISESVARCDIPKVHMEHDMPSGLQNLKELDAPVMPRPSVRAKQLGCTTFTYRILADGRTADFEMLDSKPSDAFVLPSAVAISNWQFQPSPQPDRRSFVRFTFSLADQAAPPVCMEPQFAAKNYQATGAGP